MVSAVVANSSLPRLSKKIKSDLQLVANAIRCIAMDAVEKAGSGHAGTAMGCAEIGAYLYGCFLKHNLKNPHWINRDRFILSAGHASILQYACLYLGGGPLSLEDLKCFRMMNSKTPSHPQYRLTDGVETTTGVDGQGVAHGVGQALGIKLLSGTFNKKRFSIYEAKIVVLAGDGCLMEGVSHESCALAGHLQLNNLILVYDRNKTSLDGLVSDSTTEDTKKRFEAYGWKVYQLNGHDFDAIHRVFARLKKEQTAPCLVIADTVIGQGVAQKEGSFLFHSGPIKSLDRVQAKKRFGFPPNQDFFVPSEVVQFFKAKSDRDILEEKQWNQLFQEWKQEFPKLHQKFQQMASKAFPEDLESSLANLSISETISGRKASHMVLNFLAKILPFLYGGSADLARSDMTHLNDFSIVQAGVFSGRNIKYGVREFGMACMAIGLAQTNMIRPFVGTFLAFSDYMQSGLRMAAMMRLPIVYQLTHDSFYVGQDGPTHQPIEHLAYLRAIPHLQVLRPADANEVKMAWLAALKYPGPTALIFSRQDLPPCEGTKKNYSDGVGRGAYIIKQAKGPVDYTLLATGSEVSLALMVASVLEEKYRLSIRVVSMPSWDLFDQQPEAYKESVLGKGSGQKVSIEAGSEMGWHKYTQGGLVIGLSTFGKSGLPSDLAKAFGFTTDAIVKRILNHKPRARL